MDKDDMMPDAGPSPAIADLPAVLVVDDELCIAEELAFGLEEAGMRVTMASSAVSAEAALADGDGIGVVVTDIRMPGEDGLSLVRRLVMNRPPVQAVETVVMTGHATIEDAVAAVRAGAFDFVRKPFALEEMTAVVQRALARAMARRREAREAIRIAAARACQDAGMTVDPVTGLPDRAAFLGHLAAAGAGPDGLARAGVIAFDIDHFGALNEASGSHVGDAVLAEVGRRLRDAAGAGWLVARTGSDEFAAIAVEGGGAAALLAKAEAMRALLERPINLGGDGFRLTASVGVAHAAGVGRTALDDAAALAASAARRQGGARCVMFAPALQEAAERRLVLQRELQHAIERNQVELHFQPLFRIADRSLLGFEALLRWRHPVLGPVSPGEFIPIAEDGPAILDLGAWALEGAARQVAAWRAATTRPLQVSVNISGRQIADADVPGMFAAALAAHRLPHGALVAEVTESVALGPKAPAAVAALQAMGVQVALDDFGAGHSSLGVLGSLRVDTVKLDRSLVAGIGTAPRERRLFTGLAATIHALGLKVVVEGIEAESQLRIAREAGCAAAQGYLLGRPLTAAAAGMLVVRHG
ncbi:EAL domain-containing protein [Falsiroseomonas sp. CW058]|uniref:putative bifunctional diguanylate cyclase/phosphodiesterase n=1 Tax=Falsiroseomonas sp. CW058 TaxID=3388664 RepID=UPI003D31CDEF